MYVLDFLASVTHVGELISNTLVTIVSRASLIVADGIVLGATWSATYRTFRLSRNALRGPTFATVLFLDGEPSVSLLPVLAESKHLWRVGSIYFT